MKTREINKFRKTYTKYEKKCVFEGYKLAVLFDEKDDVKRYGGRWNADEQTWWMPEGKLLNQIHDNGTLVRDWLNDNEMIIGQYGEFNGSVCNPNNATEYSLQNASGIRYTVQWWDAEDAVSFTQSLPDGKFETGCTITVENARTRWNLLISEGFIRAKTS